MRVRPIPVFAALVALLVFIPAANAACIKRHSVPIASGTSPSGEAWAVEGSIGNNGNNCHKWLFGIEFSIPDVGGWGSSTGIPAGGHLGRGFEISASDNLEEDGASRVFSGEVGAKWRK